LDVDRLYGNRDRQFRHLWNGQYTAASRDLLAVGAALLASVHRVIPVRIAVYRQVSRREESMKKPAGIQGPGASKLITERIAELGDWRGKTLSRMRKLIKAADPDVVEEWKWMGTPVWSHDGLICTGESYKAIVKLTFAKGASLKDPKKLFNSSLDGNVRRAIDIHEGEEIDESAFKALVRDAVALNSSKKAPSSR
jgi:hypothetical protein